MYISDKYLKVLHYFISTRMIKKGKISEYTPDPLEYLSFRLPETSIFK